MSNITCISEYTTPHLLYRTLTSYNGTLLGKLHISGIKKEKRSDCISTIVTVHSKVMLGAVDGTLYSTRPLF